MPSKTLEKDRDRDREIPKKDRHRATRSSHKKSTKNPDKDSTKPTRSSTTNTPTSKRRSSMPIPELERRASSSSPYGSKTSLPYPSFSKAHSKDAVGSREDVIPRRMALYTPDPTDLDVRKEGYAEGIRNNGVVTDPGGEAPPSPPLTTVTPDIKRETSSGSLRKVTMEVGQEVEQGSDAVVDEGATEMRPRIFKSKSSLRRLVKEEGSSTTRRSKSSSTAAKPKRNLFPTVEDSSSFTKSTDSLSPAPSSATGTATITDSDATSIAPTYQKMQSQHTPDADGEQSPSIGADCPTPRDAVHPSLDSYRKHTPIVDVPMPGCQRTNDYASPLPPPPPPPPMMPVVIPRVDYLLQNGGLPHNVVRTFLSKPSVPQSYQQYASPQLPAAAAAEVERIFAPFNRLLDDYTNVMSKNGSLAVATGYRSVARRLLDRLEAVFSRDISTESCNCVMCQSDQSSSQLSEYEQGVSWGEVLELVSGRRELPQWPAFSIDPSPVGLGISTLERRTPMQKLDIDVPEEFREHYLHQSRKTKQTVDRWLASQPQHPSSPPSEVDDETLTFAMLTHLVPEQRSMFTALLGPVCSQPPSRAATPLGRPRPEFLVRTGLAIQRLYRLSKSPRDPESAIYLVNNPTLHNVLATLAAISDDEWEILTSGRFDGFLRSGAEDQTPHNVATAMLSRTPSRGPNSLSRTTTPFNAAPGQLNGSFRSFTPHNPALSRGPTPAPATVGAPVTLDEETEIGVLAEVEREIYLGMEALEDAFEALHCKAEAVRQALRQRGAGLSMANQARRGSMGVEVRLGTPAMGIGGGGVGVSWESETDDGIDDGVSELAPDDSASNVSRSRVRRPKRRNERRTPAPVEEEEESA